MKLVLKAVVGLLAASTAVAAGRFAPEQLKAMYYYDLGPAAVDVASYPREQQENYKLFAQTCSRCHTLARAINSPLASRFDWKRYIARMHGKTKLTPGTGFTAEQAKHILDFLSYDSSVRKVRGKAAFDAQASELKKLFAEVKAERSRRQLESDKKKARPYDDPAAAAPRPL